MTHILLIEGSSHNAGLICERFKKTKFHIQRLDPEHVDTQTLQDPRWHLIIVEWDDGRACNSELMSMIQSSALSAPLLLVCPPESLTENLQKLQMIEHDFLLKPVSLVELKARADLLIRRRKKQLGQNVLTEAGVFLDLISRKVYRGEASISLQKNEFELLELLMRNTGRIITKTQILKMIWNYNFDPQTNVVDVLIHRLREKVDRHFQVKLIQTVRGVGYIFAPG